MELAAAPPSWTQPNHHPWKNWAIGGGLVLLFLLLLRSLLLPDPAAKLFSRALQLEVAGQLPMALRHYEILTATHPESSYAPMALQHEGDILTGMAQKRDNAQAADYLRQAVTRYLRLAEMYPSSPLAGDALLSAGDLATNNLRDTRTAKQAYHLLLDRYPNNAAYDSEATLRLGRVALVEADGKTAQTLLQRVLAHYQSFPDRCAEALYHLGVTYETLFKKKDWAQNAYQATFLRYPNSVWASTAKERLGMLFYHQRVPSLRRVMIDVAPLPEGGFTSNSPFAALRSMLAARKLEVSDITLRGWSLEPFLAGYDPTDPGRVVHSTLDGFNNAVANAGLRYTILTGQDSTSALQNLQDELDAARPPVIFNGHWTLAVGYDTSRHEVLTQNQGAHFVTIATKELTAAWKQPSSLGASYTLLAFYLPGEHPTFVKPAPGPISTGKAPTPTPGGPAETGSAQPGGTPAPNGAAPGPNAALTPDLAVSSYVYSLKPLAASAAHQRAVRRAAAQMQRPQDGTMLLNLTALEALAQELGRLAVRPVSPLPVPEVEATPAAPDAAATPGATSTAPAAADAATPAPTPATAAPAPAANSVVRARTLLAWFKAPLQHWLTERRDAIAYLEAASNALHQPVLHTAADGFRQSISELQTAAAAMPDGATLNDGGQTLSEAARQHLESAGQHIKAAHDAEARALAAMIAVG